jgi:hypothetical protein
MQKLAGSMIWATDIIEDKNTRKEGDGIFGGGQKITEYRYYANFAVAFAEGPCTGLLRLWAGEKLLADLQAPELTPGGTDNLELAWDTVVQESSTYDVAALTSGGLTYRRGFVAPTPETRLFLADSPLLADGDDALRLSSGIYRAIGGIGQPGWTGGVLFEAADPPLLLPDEVQLLVCNGTDVLPAGSTQPPYDLLVFFPGTQDDGQLLLELVFVRDVGFPEDLAGSEAYAGTAPAAAAVMKLLKNDVEVGTVTFAMGSQTGTFDLAGGALFAAGDRLAVTAPATADTTLADVALGLKGVRAS